MTRSGGVAGVQLHGEIDTTTLAADDAAQVEELVDNLGLTGLSHKRERHGGPPDRFEYQLVIERDGERHEVTIGESEVPESLRPLIDRMMAEARRRPEG